MKNYKTVSEPAGEQMTLFSLAGSLNHVSHTVQPESDLAKRMIDISGRRCLESYERLSRHGLWAKTFSALLIGQTGWYSRRCNLIWKLKGTKYNRMFFQLQVSAHRTDETEFGLLLKTPCAADAYSENLNKKEQKMGNSGTLAQEIATGFVKKRMPGLLLTPTTREEVQDLDKFQKRMEKYPNGTTMPNLATQIVGLLPTPKTQDSRHALKDRGKSNLGEEVSQWGQDNGIGSQLNPQFVAEMMGFPPNWLELPFQSTETNP